MARSVADNCWREGATAVTRPGLLVTPVTLDSSHHCERVKTKSVGGGQSNSDHSDDKATLY